MVMSSWKHLRHSAVTNHMHALANDRAAEIKAVTMGGRILKEHLIVWIPHQRKIINTSLSNDESLLMTELSWQRRWLLCDRI
jgi:hypothetical protein